MTNVYMTKHTAKARFGFGSSSVKGSRQPELFWPGGAIDISVVSRPQLVVELDNLCKVNNLYSAQGK